MFEIVLYILAIAFLVISFVKDRQKTRAALLKAWKAFAGIIPALAGFSP